MVPKTQATIKESEDLLINEYCNNLINKETKKNQSCRERFYSEL